METHFTLKYKSKSSEELLKILKSKEIYELDAIYTSALELKGREIDVSYLISDDEFIKLETEIIASLNKERSISLSSNMSKNTYYLLSLFLSPIFGGILMSYEVWKSNQKLNGLKILVLTALYFIIVGVEITLIRSDRILSFTLLLTHASGTILLCELFWVKFLKE